jgi:hypothetical protein
MYCCKISHFTKKTHRLEDMVISAFIKTWYDKHIDLVTHNDCIFWGHAKNSAEFEWTHVGRFIWMNACWSIHLNERMLVDSFEWTHVCRFIWMNVCWSIHWISLNEYIRADHACTRAWTYVFTFTKHWQTQRYMQTFICLARDACPDVRMFVYIYIYIYVNTTHT